MPITVAALPLTISNSVLKAEFRSNMLPSLVPRARSMQPSSPATASQAAGRPHDTITMAEKQAAGGESSVTHRRGPDPTVGFQSLIAHRLAALQLPYRRPRHQNCALLADAHLAAGCVHLFVDATCCRLLEGCLERRLVHPALAKMHPPQQSLALQDAWGPGWQAARETGLTWSRSRPLFALSSPPFPPLAAASASLTPAAAAVMTSSHCVHDPQHLQVIQELKQGPVHGCETPGVGLQNAHSIPAGLLTPDCAGIARCPWGEVDPCTHTLECLNANKL